MKKSLLAIAAMTAFAGAAQAQSSVTVYGILDVGFVSSNYNGTSTSANAANVGANNTTTGANVKQNVSSIGQSAESTSRLGFKGAEDLGGGTSALFTLEVGLNPNGATSLGTFNRQAFVGLKKSGLGTGSIGTQYTPLFDVQSATDAAGNNNLVGNAVYSGSLQSSTGTFNTGSGPYAGQGTASGTAGASQSTNVDNGAYVTRASNSLKLQSDRFSGFAGQLYYAQANQTTTATPGTQPFGATASGGVNNNTVWGINGDYVWNKLQVVAAYQAFKAYDTSSPTIANGAVPTNTVGIANGTAGGFGNNVADNQTYGAATYDFGILKAYYQYITRKVTAVQDSSFYTKRSANQIGVRSQLTPVISAYATFGLTNAAYYGQGLTSANGRTYQVGVDYNLSKRTNLYVAAGAANQSGNGNTSQATVANQAAVGGAGVSASNYAVGIRHTF